MSIEERQKAIDLIKLASDADANNVYDYLQKKAVAYSQLVSSYPTVADISQAPPIIIKRKDAYMVAMDTLKNVVAAMKSELITRNAAGRLVSGVPISGGVIPRRDRETIIREEKALLIVDMFARMWARFLSSYIDTVYDIRLLNIGEKAMEYRPGTLAETLAGSTKLAKGKSK